MSRGRAFAALRIGVAVVILAAAASAFARNWSAVSGELAGLGVLPLMVALLLAVVGPTLAMLGWRVLLADLGSPLPVRPAAGVFFVGQLGKYLPGSVWTVLAQAEMGSRLAVPRRRSAVVGLLAIGLSVLSGLAVGVVAVPALWGHGGARTLAWGLSAVPLVVLACWPRLLNAGIGWGLRLVRREPLEHALSGRAVLTTMAWFVGSWLAFGLQTLVLATAVGDAASPGGLVTMVSGYALAGTVGMLAVVSPAGLGVREGLLVLLLDGVIGHPAASAVALLSRFCVTVGDVLVAAAGWTYARSHGLLGGRFTPQAAGLQPGRQAGARAEAGQAAYPPVDERREG